MKRMSELKDNLRGVKCSGVKDCFKLLKTNKRRPRIVETPTAVYVRVTIDGKQYDYSGTTGAWTLTKDRGRSGRWRQSESAQDFYNKALNWSAGLLPPTDAQAGYLESLVHQTGRKPHSKAFLSLKICSNEIDRLKIVLEKQLVVS